MALKNDRYTYRVTWSEVALRGIRKLVEDVVKDMQDEGEAVPEPIACRHYSGKFMIRIPPQVHRKLAIQAAESGVSLNRLASSKLSQ
jgi:predicted HicB family RNase H-like nuclease